MALSFRHMSILLLAASCMTAESTMPAGEQVAAVLSFTTGQPVAVLLQQCAADPNTEQCLQIQGLLDQALVELLSDFPPGTTAEVIQVRPVPADTVGAVVIEVEFLIMLPAGVPAAAVVPTIVHPDTAAGTEVFLDANLASLAPGLEASDVSFTASIVTTTMAPTTTALVPTTLVPTTVMTTLVTTTRSHDMGPTAGPSIVPSSGPTFGPTVGPSSVPSSGPAVVSVPSPGPDTTVTMPMPATTMPATTMATTMAATMATTMPTTTLAATTMPAGEEVMAVLSFTTGQPVGVLLQECASDPNTQECLQIQGLLDQALVELLSDFPEGTTAEVIQVRAVPVSDERRLAAAQPRRLRRRLTVGTVVIEVEFLITLPAGVPAAAVVPTILHPDTAAGTEVFLDANLASLAPGLEASDVSFTASIVPASAPAK